MHEIATEKSNLKRKRALGKNNNSIDECLRCGRSAHRVSSCYASTDMSGTVINNTSARYENSESDSDSDSDSDNDTNDT